MQSRRWVLKASFASSLLATSVLVVWGCLRPETPTTTTSAAAQPSAPTSAAPVAPPVAEGGASDGQVAARSAPDSSAAVAEPNPRSRYQGPPIRKPTEYAASRVASASMRMKQARTLRLATVEQLFRDAAVTYPPKQLLLRGFKQEGLLEVWAGSGSTGPLTHVTTYGFCYASGKVGPKRRNGDSQVPEGFYTIGFFNSGSAYHLSMQVNYPNPSDRILGHPTDPGSDIMIHGDCVSIGCISLSDERIEELWLIATSIRNWRGRIHVHLFPALDTAGLIAAGEHPQHHEFWRNLIDISALFERAKTIPAIAIDGQGRYVAR